jgi:4-oxalomesaconate tautomerase
VGERMNLGDVKEKSVPKMMLVAPPKNGGAVTVRSFIPHRAHATIGVLGAVSDRLPHPRFAGGRGGVIPEGARKTLSVEHPPAK